MVRPPGRLRNSETHCTLAIDHTCTLRARCTKPGARVPRHRCARVGYPQGRAIDQNQVHAQRKKKPRDLRGVSKLKGCGQSVARLRHTLNQHANRFRFDHLDSDGCNRDLARCIDTRDTVILAIPRNFGAKVTPVEVVHRCTDFDD